MWTSSRSVVRSGPPLVATRIAVSIASRFPSTSVAARSDDLPPSRCSASAVRILRADGLIASIREDAMASTRSSTCANVSKGWGLPPACRVFSARTAAEASPAVATTSRDRRGVHPPRGSGTYAW